MFHEVVNNLNKVSGPDHQGWHTALCPFHDDLNHPNLRFNERGFRCFACGEKGSLSKLAKKLGVKSEAEPSRKNPKAAIEATYDYRDERGNVLFQVVRYRPKAFNQRRPDGTGGWVWNLDGVRRMLFQLPELLASPKEALIFFPEGEKDVQAVRSLGLVATCNPGGVGKFTIEMREPLKHGHVVVVADKDEPGRRHAQQVAGLLYGFAATVKVIELPGDKIKDAADWVTAGGTATELLTIVEAAPLWETQKGPELLDSVVGFIRRFVVLSGHQADAIAVWVVHTYALDAAEATPYLNITSAEKRSGKTRLLETLELLVARPWFTGRVTAAVLARKVDAECPTLLLDESDAAFKGQREYAETLRSLLNTGYRRGGRSSICVGQGANIGYRDLSTFCPKAIAGIGKLPDTVADRSMAIMLKRRAAGENVERFRRRIAEREASGVRDRISGWASAIRLAADPEIPAALDDRAADCWEPLFAIASTVGGGWSERARVAAISLMASESDSESLGIRLLGDIRWVFGERDRLPSAELADALVQFEEGPWGDLGGRPLDARRLASLLKRYGIRPHGIRIDSTTPKGYEGKDFIDAWRRYLPVLSGAGSATPQHPESRRPPPSGAKDPQQVPSEVPVVADSSQAQPRLNVADVADKTGGKPAFAVERDEESEMNRAAGGAQWEVEL